MAYGPYSSLASYNTTDNSTFDLVYRPWVADRSPTNFDDFESFYKKDLQWTNPLASSNTAGLLNLNATTRSDRRTQEQTTTAFLLYKKFLVKSYEGISEEAKIQIKEDIAKTVTSIYEIAGAPLKPRVVFARSIKDFCFLQFFISSMSLVPMMAEVASWPEFVTWFGEGHSLKSFTKDLFEAFHSDKNTINPYEPSEELQTLLGKLRQDFSQKNFKGGEERCIEVFSEAVKRIVPHNADKIETFSKNPNDVRSRLASVFKSFNSNPIPDPDIIHAAYQHEYMYGRDVCWTAIIKLLQFSRDVLFLNGFCVILEPPKVMRLDNRVRFHSLDSPAFIDGDVDANQYYSLCGVGVKKDYIENFDKLKPKTILQEGNSEVRRVLMEKYGYEKFVQDLGTKPFHSDDFGSLYRIELADDEPLCMVSVINKTAEPDGSFKEYWLRVPPDITTAKAACAWTFRMKPEEYVLADES